MPEKVVPCVWSATAPRVACASWGAGLGWAYKVDAHDELGLGASLARGLCHARAAVCCRRAMGSRHWRRRTVAPGTVLGRLGLRRVARRTALGRIAYGLLGVCWVARRAGVDGWELRLVSIQAHTVQQCSAVHVSFIPDSWAGHAAAAGARGRLAGARMCTRAGGPGCSAGSWGATSCSSCWPGAIATSVGLRRWGCCRRECSAGAGARNSCVSNRRGS